MYMEEIKEISAIYVRTTVYKSKLRNIIGARCIVFHPACNINGWLLVQKLLVYEWDKQKNGLKPEKKERKN